METSSPTENQRHFSISLVDSNGRDQNHENDTSNNSANLPPFQGYTDNNSLSPNSALNSDAAMAASYSTLRSLRRMTRDALPRLDHYRNMSSIVKGAGSCAQRPTIDELLQPSADKQELVKDEENAEAQAAPPGIQFGWVRGVLVRCLLNIWGVILFLRISWVTAQCGILQGTGIAVCSTVVTVLTTLSMSAIGTNGQIKGGGTYFMISRSLGPEVGGATGIVFSFANAINCSLNIVGFCESLNSLIVSYDTKVFDGSLNDIRLYSCITLIVLLIICVIGMEWEARAQLLLLVILLFAMADFIIGSFVGPLSDVAKAKGFVGINGTVFMNNLWSDYRVDEDTGEQQNFFTVFSIYFPACTGILAGASISGDLKDPIGGIPKGTLLGIILTTLSYIVFIWLSGAATLRDATGNVTQLADWSFANCTGMECKYGLHNSPQVMEVMSLYGPLIFAGMFAASISTALSSLVCAPKIFQALCQDNLYPYIGFFGKGTAKNDDPVRGYILSAFIVIVFNLIARLDTIAPIITNFFLATFALINFACFHASMQKIPSWRPTFRYYNAWISLFGGLLCTAIMFLIEWWTALLTLLISALFYVIVKYRKPDVNWGSSTQAQTYTVALNSVSSLSNVEEHVKTYRPQILVLSGAPNSRPPLIHFANSITKHMSLLMCGHCISDSLSKNKRIQITEEATKWLQRHKLKAFYSLSDGLPMDKGARVLMTNSGLGRLQPNTVLMGYKSDWQTCPSDELQSYFKTIVHAFDMHLAVGVLRVDGGLDYSYVVEALHGDQEPITNGSSSPITERSASGDVTTPDANIQGISFQYSTTPHTETKSPDLASGKKKGPTEYRTANGDVIPNHVIDNMLFFTKKQPKGTIDVWWLFDDGGLTLLIPYILTTRSMWSQCSLRIFFLASKTDDLDAEQRKMAELLCMFRIDYSDVIMIPDITQKPRDQSTKDFNNLISKFQGDSADGESGIKESDLLAMKAKTNRHIRLRELLLEHSRQSSLIVMTLPVPAVGRVPAPLYMAWLETLTKDMPPFLLVRGNQTSVLTFYS